MSIKVKKTKRQTKSSSVTASHKSSNYVDAKESITAAIHSLGDAAKSGDSLARESIANLSVVLFDLQ